MLIDRCRPQLWLIAALTLIVCPGCDQTFFNRSSEIVEVNGTVYLDDLPVEGARVVFVPLESTVDNYRDTEGVVLSYGVTDASGRFELQQADGTKGAVEGIHRVYVSKISERSVLQNTVQGVVVADGEPVGNAELQFVPENSDSAEGSAPISGKTNAQGEFEISRTKGTSEHGLPFQQIPVAAGEQIPFYYNLQSDLTYEVAGDNGNRQPEFRLSSIDPLLK